MIHYVPYLIAFHSITNDILVAMAYTPHPCFQRGVNGALFECVTNAKTKIPSLKARGR